MKKLIGLFILLAINTHALAGGWKHHYFEIEGNQFRLSYTEEIETPHYNSRPGGNRVAHNVYLDGWGENISNKSIYWSLTSRTHYSENHINDDIIRNDFFQKEGRNHIYENLLSGIEEIYLETHYKHSIIIEISIDGRRHTKVLNRI